MPGGLFITLEGGDGSGKSTQGGSRLQSALGELERSRRPRYASREAPR